MSEFRKLFLYEVSSQVKINTDYSSQFQCLYDNCIKQVIYIIINKQIYELLSRKLQIGRGNC